MTNEGEVELVVTMDTVGRGLSGKELAAKPELIKLLDCNSEAALVDDN